MDHTERAIVSRVITAAFAKNYVISVFDGEEYAIRRSSNHDAIMEVLGATETDALIIRNTPQRDVVGVIQLIYGNGRDVIADHTDNPETNALVEFTRD